MGYKYKMRIIDAVKKAPCRDVVSATNPNEFNIGFLVEIERIEHNNQIDLANQYIISEDSVYVVKSHEYVNRRSTYEIELLAVFKRAMRSDAMECEFEL